MPIYFILDKEESRNILSDGKIYTTFASLFAIRICRMRVQFVVVGRR